MSWPAVAWAMAQRAPSSPAKFVLLALADAARMGDWLAWPSVAHLCERTQQDRKTVLANLKKLEAQGLIARAGKAGRTGQIAVWRLPVTAVEKSPRNGWLQLDETVPDLPSKGADSPVQASQERDMEPVMNLNETERGRAASHPGSGRGCRLPQDWKPSEDDQAFCRQQRPELDPQCVAESFRDHWTSKTGRDAAKHDWSATWRNWVRRERGPVAASHGPPARKPVLHCDKVFTGAPRLPPAGNGHSSAARVRR